MKSGAFTCSLCFSPSVVCQNQSAETYCTVNSCCQRTFHIVQRRAYTHSETHTSIIRKLQQLFYPNRQLARCGAGFFLTPCNCFQHFIEYAFQDYCLKVFANTIICTILLYETTKTHNINNSWRGILASAGCSEGEAIHIHFKNRSGKF